MKVYKFGGNILKNKETRYHIYKKLKEEKDKVIIVVSALKDNPYSSNALEELILPCQNKEIKERMLSIGETVSSLLICNEMQQQYFNCDIIFPEEIGIEIEKNEDKIQLISLDNTLLLEKLKKSDFIIFPGFIAKEKGNLVTLNRGGSDLTAMYLADMLHIEEVTLFKDVIGVCKCDPHLIQNQELISHIGYDRMLNFCRHGSQIVQLDALKYAKNKKIKIRIQHYALDNGGTLIDDKKGDSSLGIHILKNHVYIDGYPLGEKIKALLFNNEIPYDYLTLINDSIDIQTNFGNELEIFNIIYHHFFRG